MILLKSFAIVITICSFTVHVQSQTCDTTNANSSCSSNTACGCLPMAFTNNLGLCGLVDINCSRLNVCQQDDTCPGLDHICIRHPGCGATPRCYPLSMSDPRLCPPMTPTTTSTPTAPFFTSQTMTGFETTGYDFLDTTSMVYPSGNSVISHYSSALTTSSSMLEGQNKHYETIEIRVQTSGSYDIRSVSAIDTYGCLYREDYRPSNEILCVDDSHGNQFGFVVNLQAGMSYTLLVTTFGIQVTGSYAVSIQGPAYVELTRVDSASETTMTYETTEAPNAAAYSSALTLNSPKWYNQSKYYEAIRITTRASGLYTLTSRETLDGIGSLYMLPFNPVNPVMNRFSFDDRSGGANQFSISVYLQGGANYILVFSTREENITGPFSILTYGPDALQLTPFAPSPATTSTPFTFTSDHTNSSVIVSEYSSELTPASNNFSRTERSESNYFYEAIEVAVNTTGFYTFSSHYSASEYTPMNGSRVISSRMDTFGYMYESRFFPADPRVNLLVEDDDSAGAGQFHFRLFLGARKNYVLVVTTYNSDVTGSFSIVTSGPDNVFFNPMTQI